MIVNVTLILLYYDYTCLSMAAVQADKLSAGG